MESIQKYVERRTDSHDDIAVKLSELTKRFDEFSDKYETIHYELKITQNYNSLLL